MAVSSASRVARTPQGVTVLRVVGSASYTTGGDALPAGTIEGVAFYGVAQGPISGTRTYVWNNNLQTLVAFDAFATQEGAATDCSADIVYLVGATV